MALLDKLLPVCLKRNNGPLVKNSHIFLVRHLSEFTGLICPRRDNARNFLHRIFNDRRCTGTRWHGTIIIAIHDHLPAYEAGHVATVTLANRQLVFGFFILDGVIGPRNKPAWSERLMTSAALTRRTVLELRVPVISWNLFECFAQ